ncbi:sensor histidine kinase [Actinomadura sp. PM05-2]|uniref:Sensor histidine kinase n=1 Tax=Actinomadura parmotrematis TaxID=2864039 RepID=A0ABS7G303_9ACTN|nr:sensor histidine kinase [Actinomadura parmotrematis]
MPPDGFVHAALIYQDADAYVAGVLPFLRAGLRDGTPVAVAVPGPRLGALRDALGAEGARVTWMDMADVGRNPGWIIPGVLRAFTDRHPGPGRARIVAEAVWPGRSALEYPACAQHEALVGLAFEGRDIALLCPFDAAGLAPSALDDARATHGWLGAGADARRSGGFAPERVLADCNTALPEPADAASLDFDRDALPALRRFACEHAAALGLGRRRVGELELAVNEMAANSVVHGGGRGRLRVWAEDGYVVCEIADAGRIRDPLAGRRPVAMSTDGGRGLLMVHHLADLVRVRSGPEGTAVRAYLRA